MVCSAQEFLAQSKTLNVCVVSIKEESTEVSFCEKCGVEVTATKVRRERMGHIELASPVSTYMVP